MSLAVECDIHCGTCSKSNFQVIMMRDAKESEQQSRLETRTKESYLYARIRDTSETRIRKETERTGNPNMNLE